MASFELGFTRKLLKDFFSKASSEILFMQLSHVYTSSSKEASSSSSSSIGYQLLVEGKRDALTLPDDCEVMGILDETGESLTDINYIGAQRRENSSADLLSLQHTNSVASVNLNNSMLKE